MHWIALALVCIGAGLLMTLGLVEHRDLWWAGSLAGACIGCAVILVDRMYR